MINDNRRVNMVPIMPMNDPELDRQNEEILQLILDICVSARRSRASSTMMAQVVTLVDLMVYHFITEEILMQGTEYPQQLRHASLHAALIDRLLETVNALKTEKNSAAELAAESLLDLFVGHLRTQDCQFSDFLAKRSLAA